MGHRGGFSIGPAPARPQVTPGHTPVDPHSFRGFSYFLGEPDVDCRTTIGADPAKAREILTALYSLLPVGCLEDNTNIPAGYTYLLQFIAHDLVETTVPFWAAAEAGVPSRNMRDATLALDTLYGGGPVACPIAFEPAGNMVDYRTHLRLGKVADAIGLEPAVPGCPYRDLARLQLAEPAPPSNLSATSQVYAADERSDDNTLLSQIVVLFSIMHNAIAAKLIHLGAQARYAHASTAVLTMYHAIIRHDLMQKLLLEEVYQELADRRKDSNWLWDGKGVPLEFTHGAFRVGHAMVRPYYQFNTANRFDIGQVLGGPQVGEPSRDPLPSTWIVEWQRFFDFENGVEPNYSLKLAISQQRPLDFFGDFQPVAADSPTHLTVRDWLSAANARTWRLNKLVDAVTRRYPKLSPMTTAEISTWLDKLIKTSLGTNKAKNIVSDNQAWLATDLPLPLYILLEAEAQPLNGARLGPLGSVIVGETIFRCLTAAEASLAHLQPAAARALGGDWQQISKVRSMPDFIRLAEAWADLNDCPQLPFIAP